MLSETCASASWRLAALGVAEPFAVKDGFETRLQRSGFLFVRSRRSERHAPQGRGAPWLA